MDSSSSSSSSSSSVPTKRKADDIVITTNTNNDNNDNKNSSSHDGTEESQAAKRQKLETPPESETKQQPQPQQPPQQQQQPQAAHSETPAPPKREENLPTCLSSDPVSRVVHFRNVSADVSQSEVMALAQPFGAIARVVLMRDNKQALLEFGSARSSIEMINYYLSRGEEPTVRGRKLYLKFSRHSELKEGGGQNVILATLVPAVDLEAYGLTFTADMIYQALVPYGVINKIVLPAKAKTHQALIEFASVAAAAQVMSTLDNRTVPMGVEPYVFEVLLNLQYSKLGELIVKQQSQRGRDYSKQPFSGFATFGAAVSPSSAAAVAAVAAGGGGGASFRHNPAALISAGMGHLAHMGNMMYSHPAAAYGHPYPSAAIYAQFAQQMSPYYAAQYSVGPPTDVGSVPVAPGVVAAAPATTAAPASSSSSSSSSTSTSSSNPASSNTSSSATNPGFNHH